MGNFHLRRFDYLDRENICTSLSSTRINRWFLNDGGFYGSTNSIHPNRLFLIGFAGCWRRSGREPGQWSWMWSGKAGLDGLWEPKTNCASGDDGNDERHLRQPNIRDLLRHVRLYQRWRNYEEQAHEFG